MCVNTWCQNSDSTVVLVLFWYISQCTGTLEIKSILKLKCSFNSDFQLWESEQSYQLRINIQDGSSECNG